MIDVLLTAYSFYQNWGGWTTIAVIAAITSIIINAILLMFGRGFSIKDLEKFAESEILQAGATALMAISLIWLVSQAQSYVYSSQLVRGTYNCFGEVRQLGQEEGEGFNDALDAARCSIQQKAQAIASIQERAISGNDVRGLFYAYNIQIGIIGITIYKGDYVTTLYKTLENWRFINNFATTLLVGLNSVSFLMLYVKRNMLTLFLPLGILLRGFYFTRGPGAFLMSLAIGMYFIFPILYVILDPAFIPTPVPPSALNPPAGSNLCYPTFTSASVMLSTVQQHVLSGGTVTSQSASEDLRKVYTTLLLHPLIALFLTLAFVRYLMTVLGGDTYELTKLVTKVI